jgi:hypothetical protein
MLELPAASYFLKPVNKECKPNYMSSPFRLEFDPKPFEKKIHIGQHIMLMGSCFTEHIHQRLESYKFNCLQNPHGVLFNPISIFTSLNHYLDESIIENDDLFDVQGLWRHWSFHSSLSSADKNTARIAMNDAIIKGSSYIKKADWLILTLGSAFVYYHNNQIPVSNCHKVPATEFVKKLITTEKIVLDFEQVYNKLLLVNPKLKLILTISPVRHLRDGFVENNRSKAILINAVDQICDRYNDVAYFPSYELIIDDLRDYRFYAEDMVHPNYLATKYVWNKFVQTAFDGSTKEVIKELDEINSAYQHRVLHPDSAEHQIFRTKYRKKILELSNRFPQMDLHNEMLHFS